MSYDFDAPEAEEMGRSSEGNFLAKPGQYHLTIANVAEGVGPKGKPIDGFCVTVLVLTGTSPGQKGKVANIMFFAPKLSSKDGGAFLRRKMTAFGIAANLIDPSALGKRVSLELKDAINHQVIAKFESSKADDGREYIDLAYADIWHVDDPRCETVPKDASAITLIPREFRRGREWFAFLKSEPKQNQNGSEDSKQPTLNLDEL